MNQVVVVGIDGSARARAAARWAAQEAVLRGGPLCIAYATTGPRLPASSAALDEVRKEVTVRHPALSVGTRMLSGQPLESLLACAEHTGLLVVGLRGADGFAGLALGSVALGAAARASVPVALVPGPLDGHRPPVRPDQVMLGIDARAPLDGAIDCAFTAARRGGLRLHAVHAWSLPPSPEWRGHWWLPAKDRASWEDQEVQSLSDALSPWRAKYPSVRVLEDVVLFEPGHALVRAAASAEVLVVGRCEAGRLGPVVLGLLPHARCPVVVAPS
ncbi:universal stress protein [Streptomyces sp. NPDC102467]|uniref:universal stress protein n=1 Tax=Streptomyces sp. NPDC102467 TaxID=3366179 RepID=UPI003813F416